MVILEVNKPTLETLLYIVNLYFVYVCVCVSQYKKSVQKTQIEHTFFVGFLDISHAFVLPILVCV